MKCNAIFLVNEIVYLFKFQVIALPVLTMDLPHNIIEIVELDTAEI